MDVHEFEPESLKSEILLLSRQVYHEFVDFLYCDTNIFKSEIFVFLRCANLYCMIISGLEMSFIKNMHKIRVFCRESSPTIPSARRGF